MYLNSPIHPPGSNGDENLIPKYPSNNIRQIDSRALNTSCVFFCLKWYRTQLKARETHHLHSSCSYPVFLGLAMQYSDMQEPLFHTEIGGITNWLTRSLCMNRLSVTQRHHRRHTAQLRCTAAMPRAQTISRRWPLLMTNVAIYLARRRRCGGGGGE